MAITIIPNCRILIYFKIKRIYFLAGKPGSLKGGSILGSCGFGGSTGKGTLGFFCPKRLSQSGRRVPGISAPPLGFSQGNIYKINPKITSVITILHNIMNIIISIVMLFTLSRINPRLLL